MQAGNFFERLSQKQRRQYWIPELGGQVGYTPLGVESAKDKDEDEGDLKEYFSIGRGQGELLNWEKAIHKANTFSEPNFSRERHSYPRNVWPEELPNFKHASIKAYKAFEKTATIMLQAIAAYVGVHEQYFAERAINGDSLLRALHYPPQDELPEGLGNRVRSAPHEDINLLTLLAASGPGLHVQVEGAWMPFTPSENQLVVNIGDMMQHMTNGVLKSTKHYVANPEKEGWDRRYAFPFFTHLRSDIPLTVLDSCVTSKRALQYDSEKTAGQYLHERLTELGLLN
jgi:isopenicillin N synthase-like dioxygenase